MKFSKMNFHKIAGAVLLLPLFLGCSTDKKSHSTIFGNEDEEKEEETIDEYEYIEDSINGQEVRHNLAVIFTKIQEQQWGWENVKSPSMLATQRARWMDSKGKIEEMMEQLNDEERTPIDSLLNIVKELEQTQTKKFAVPAEGVLYNLKSCIKDIDKAKTLQEFNRFRNPRLGMLQSLETIHLCVDPNEREMGEVKRLANIVRQKYKEKCHKFGLKR